MNIIKTKAAIGKMTRSCALSKNFHLKEIYGKLRLSSSARNFG